MGNSISHLCCQNELMKQRGEVLVIKEDGESVRFKDGTLVKDVLSAYPYHKIIKCCTEKTVLMGEVQLSCNSLYFLLPAGLALSEAAYQSLVRSAASRNLVANMSSRIQINENNQQASLGGDRQDHAYIDYSCSYKWKPVLRTIPEIATPST
ncbi:hypothetical protein L1987_04044 [Smallanthus sonchifolius]|uniref:Uncharacterized protein n=1 Tax=Smallanthus sonchifolius TaxID=185202 RepID=A0ACB9KCG4_9ASTR|nr:hypothetical protein L1987_04044 [Smallanthus sonchifolius]